MFVTESEFEEFVLKCVGQTSDKASTMAGNQTGANKKIREDILHNEKLPKIICTATLPRAYVFISTSIFIIIIPLDS